jgi:hypothetical protein
MRRQQNFQSGRKSAGKSAFWHACFLGTITSSDNAAQFAEQTEHLILGWLAYAVE